ncbi:nucleolar protein 4-like [Crotalus adamanteus]|uniref:Nucleolar protein 4-like n=1 Tax=Crotalus adamanteus TaxID=8729 RepID=A0AAW1BS44_CROAD
MPIIPCQHGGGGGGGEGTQDHAVHPSFPSPGVFRRGGLHSLSHPPRPTRCVSPPRVFRRGALQPPSSPAGRKGPKSRWRLLSGTRESAALGNVPAPLPPRAGQAAGRGRPSGRPHVALARPGASAPLPSPEGSRRAQQQQQQQRGRQASRRAQRSPGRAGQRLSREAPPASPGPAHPSLPAGAPAGLSRPVPPQRFVSGSFQPAAAGGGRAPGPSARGRQQLGGPARLSQAGAAAAAAPRPTARPSSGRPAPSLEEDGPPAPAARPPARPCALRPGRDEAGRRGGAALTGGIPRRGGGGGGRRAQRRPEEAPAQPPDRPPSAAARPASPGPAGPGAAAAAEAAAEEEKLPPAPAGLLLRRLLLLLLLLLLPASAAPGRAQQRSLARPGQDSLGSPAMPKPPPPPPAPPPLLRSAGGNRPGDSELGRQFRDWCLRTYGDSAKTKTVTRSKYQRIAEVLQGGGGGGGNGNGGNGGGGGGEKGKFQFWVRSKGFRLGNGPREPPAAKMGPGVVYVPVKTGTVSAARGRRNGPGWVCVPHCPGGGAGREDGGDARGGTAREDGAGGGREGGSRRGLRRCCFLHRAGGAPLPAPGGGSRGRGRLLYLAVCARHPRPSPIAPRPGTCSSPPPARPAGLAGPLASDCLLVPRRLGRGGRGAGEEEEGAPPPARRPPWAETAAAKGNAGGTAPPPPPLAPPRGPSAPAGRRLQVGAGPARAAPACPCWQRSRSARREQQLIVPRLPGGRRAASEPPPHPSEPSRAGRAVPPSLPLSLPSRPGQESPAEQRRHCSLPRGSTFCGAGGRARGGGVSRLPRGSSPRPPRSPPASPPRPQPPLPCRLCQGGVWHPVGLGGGGWLAASSPPVPCTICPGDWALGRQSVGGAGLAGKVHLCVCVCVVVQGRARVLVCVCARETREAACARPCACLPPSLPPPGKEAPSRLSAATAARWLAGRSLHAEAKGLSQAPEGGGAVGTSPLPSCPSCPMASSLKKRSKKLRKVLAGNDGRCSPSQLAVSLGLGAPAVAGKMEAGGSVFPCQWGGFLSLWSSPPTSVLLGNWDPPQPGSPSPGSSAKVLGCRQRGPGGRARSWQGREGLAEDPLPGALGSAVGHEKKKKEEEDEGTAPVGGTGQERGPGREAHPLHRLGKGYPRGAARSESGTFRPDTLRLPPLPCPQWLGAGSAVSGNVPAAGAENQETKSFLSTLSPPHSPPGRISGARALPGCSEPPSALDKPTWASNGGLSRARPLTFGLIECSQDAHAFLQPAGLATKWGDV